MVFSGGISVNKYKTNKTLVLLALNLIAKGMSFSTCPLPQPTFL